MKFVCSVCGYVYEGDTVPAECPVCHAGSDKFVAQSDERTWAEEMAVELAEKNELISKIKLVIKKVKKEKIGRAHV